MSAPDRWTVKDAVIGPDSTLTPSQRLVMLVLVLRANATTGAIPADHMPSLTTLADETGLARSTVAVVIGDLERLGWLAVHRPSELQRGRRMRNRYVLAAPVHTGPVTGPGEPDTGPVTGPDTSGHRYGDTSGDRTSFSSSSTHSAAAAAARDPEPSTTEARAVADLVHRLEVTTPDAQLLVVHLLATRRGVRSVRALVRSIPDAELLDHLAQARDDAAAAEEDTARVARDQADTAAALTVACQVCESDPGQACTDLGTRAPIAGVHGPRRRLLRAAS